MAQGKTVLVADVGGTNARFALAVNGDLVPGSLRRLVNAGYPSFGAALDAYLATLGGSVAAASIAVAGPVANGRARLTNRDWTFDAGALSDRLGAPVRLMNDLTALGYAVAGGLAPNGLVPICTAVPGEEMADNGQALVVGLGTGVNLCAVLRSGAQTICSEAEAGHISLPGAVMRGLGDRAAHFHSIEDLLSGRGLERLHELEGSTESAGGAQIIKAHLASGGGAATVALTRHARALGACCRDLALLFLPYGGIYLAGSVARGMVDAGMAGVFNAAYREDLHFAAVPRAIPVSLVVDDMAALTGAAAVAR